MINVSIYKSAENLITGFILSGHADYSKRGSDIVCSAVSVLVINTINSIEQFTSDEFSIEQDEKKGFIEFHVISQVSEKTNLLMNSLELGLSGVADNYTEKYIKISQINSQ
jgi:uncharacterized protein